MSLLYEKYDLNEEAISIVKSFHVKFKAKNLMKEGQKCKERLKSKLFNQKSQFQLTVKFFLFVLPLFKSLVLILEQKEPLIHRTHLMLCENLKLLFACYIKFESLTPLDPKGLKSMDAENNIRKLETLYVGDEAEKLAKSLMKSQILQPIVPDFYKTVKKAYIQDGKYLQQKYPIKNPLLEFLAGLDPNMHQMSQTHERLLSLKLFFEYFVSKENPSDCSAELRNYVVDSDLPQLQNSEGVDVWWNKVFETKQYPMLSSIVRASLSIFTGPVVESSFSM